MKHEILVIAGVLAALVFFRAPAYGEDLEKSKFCDQKTFANSINLKFIWIKTLSHNSLFAEEADIYNVWEKRIGFGIDTTLASGNFFDVRPYATFSNGQLPAIFLVGYEAASTGARFVDYGMWYTLKARALDILLGAVNFSAVSPEARDYLDSFAGMTAPLGAYSVGIDLEEIHRWNGKADTLFVGPALHSKIGVLTLTTRLLLEKRLSPGPGKDGYEASVGLRIPFDAL